MKKQYGFIRFDIIDEFETWLNKQNVKRKVNRLQVHNMYLPDYNTWNTTDKRVYGDNRELGRTKSLDDYGKNTWNYPDDNNHYIAQHFNVFPNGKITTGRDLDSTPIGIKGWNTNAICIEIYGNFDYVNLPNTLESNLEQLNSVDLFNVMDFVVSLNNQIKWENDARTLIELSILIYCGKE